MACGKGSVSVGALAGASDRLIASAAQSAAAIGLCTSTSSSLRASSQVGRSARRRAREVLESSIVVASATSLVRGALRETGIELIASCSAVAYDACAPEPLRSARWLAGARGLVVAGSAGPALWRGFLTWMAEEPERWTSAHPYDTFVADRLSRADAALAGAGMGYRRFEAAFHAPDRIDFLALARLVGLGSPGPFGLLIHPQHGPWWALRGAWIVDAAVDSPLDARSPCVGCSAPCVGGWANAGGIDRATAEARGRCVVGQGSRYDDDQIGYHYERATTAARLGARTA
jgi:hypothetical protein